MFALLVLQLQYRGAWLDGNMQGQGKYYWANGSSFEGAFRDDEISGPGYAS
jgi:hypothetical protein